MCSMVLVSDKKAEKRGGGFSTQFLGMFNFSIHSYNRDPQMFQMYNLKFCNVNKL